MFNDTVTLLCRFGPMKAEAFSTTVVHGVHLSCGQGAATHATHAQRKANALLLIPFSAAEDYVSPTVWQSLSPEQRAAHWSLAVGDVFVPGIFSEDGMYSPAALLAQGGGFVVTGVAERHTHSAMAHFAVSGGQSALQGGEA